MNKIIAKLTFVLVLFLFCNCTQHNNKNKTYYKAIHEKDTAYLSIHQVENQFYGQLEIRYGGKFLKDSGAVSGFIKKDTFRGNFKFFPYGGGQAKRKPIILLSHEGKLILGKGSTYTLYGITYFEKNTSFDFKNAEFVFEELDK